MKKNLLSVCGLAVCVATPAMAQVYNNGGLVTDPGAGFGGADASQLQVGAFGLNIFGFGHQSALGNTVADDVTPTVNTPVNFLNFFAYQSGSGTAASPFTAVDVKIYNADPSTGATPIYTTSGLTQSTLANIYRVLDTTLTDNFRPIWVNRVDTPGGPTLLAGNTYWIEWGSQGSASFSGPWVPPVTILGEASKPGSNGQQNLAGVWGPALDVVVQDFPFLINTGPFTPIKVTLVGSIPVSVQPGNPTNLTVNVNPNDETLVGTPQLCYRTAAGPFTCTNLVNLGGNNWQGTLPSFVCGDEPEFYFSAVGSTSGQVNLPTAAPTTLFSTTVATGTQGGSVTEGFNSGLPSGWTASGLWNVTNTCASGTSCDGGSFAYYGITGQCTFNNGAASSGSLVSPVVNIGPTSKLKFCFQYDGEGGFPYDAAGVRINGTDVWTVPGSTLSWTPVEVDLSAYSGQSVNIEFFFDTVDSIANDFLGFAVDGFELNSEVFVCEGGCYPDCDGSGSLNIDDFICFQTFFAIGDPYADCDGSGGLNIDDFICFQTFYAIGC